MTAIHISRNSLRPLATAITVAWAFFAVPAFSQQDDDDIPVDVRERTWLDLAATGVIASGNSVDANEDEDRSGGFFRAGLNWSRDAGVDHFDLGASSAYYLYTDADRSDRWSNALSLAYGHDISDTVELSVRARAATKLTTLEDREADEARLQGRVTFHDGNHRVRVTGGWRWRDYQDRDFGTGDGPMGEVEYRYRIGKGNYVLVEGIYDAIESDIPTLTYDRITLHGVGRVALQKNLDLDLGLRWRDWDNKYRLIGTEKRTASSFAPEAELSYEFAKDWTLSAAGTIIWRHSNDPGYQRTVYRGFLTLERRFWLDR